MEEIAHAVCDAADVFQVPLFGMTGTLHETVYPARGHAFVAEYYADLDYARRRPPDHHARASKRSIRPRPRRAVSAPCATA